MGDFFYVLVFAVFFFFFFFFFQSDDGSNRSRTGVLSFPYDPGYLAHFEP